MKVKRKGINKAVLNLLKDVKKKKVAVGLFPQHVYPDGTPIAYVASIHEFGAKGMPPRSFMRTTIKAQRNEWRQQMAGAIKAVSMGAIDYTDALDQIGALGAGDVVKTIDRMEEPKLDPKTVKRKGFDTLLVDTGLMRQSITWEVEDA